MKALRRSAAAALLVLTAPAALAETKAWQDTLTLPTWLEGPPETVPRIEPIHPTKAQFPYVTYPYSIRLNFTEKDVSELYFALGSALLSFRDGKSAAPSVLQEGIAAAHSKELKDRLVSVALPPNPSPVSSQAAPPRPKPTTPGETAEYALDLVADGKVVAAAALFTVENFPRDKQPDSIQKAYIEVQLQVLRNDADHLNCADALRGVASIGAGETAVPFTLNGFGALMNGARFQYYLGAVENLCGKAKAARQRWNQVARMKPEIFSPDFSFPVVAAQSLAAKGKGPKIQPWLDEVSKALDSAGGTAKGTLLYSKGVLLLAMGQEVPGLAKFEEGLAIGAFEDGARAPDSGMSRYLSNLVLWEARKTDPQNK